MLVLTLERRRQSIIKMVLFFSILVSAIIHSGSSHAETIWERRKKAVQDITGAAQKPAREQVAQTTTTIGSIDPSEITIPDRYGTIIETYNNGSNGKLIVHIQDAHMNYEGQKNAANILESLIENHDLNLILLEGKVSDLNFNYIRARAPLEERIKRADALLRKGKINGVNYLNIATDHRMTILGIEDKDLYDRNISTLWEIDDFKDQASSYVNRLITASNALKPEIYTSALIELDKKKRDYDAEEIDLLEYYEYLYNIAEENDIPLYVFPNFQNLIKANELERSIDLVKVRTGDASSGEMELYSEYLDLTRDLNINELFKEEPMLEDAVQGILTVTSDQKNLIRISNALSIVNNLLKIKVVPEEYEYFVENKKYFDPRFWSDFVKNKSSELGLDLSVPENHYVISDNLVTIEKFYGLAAERNKVFVKRVDEHMEDEDVRLSALVAGGFHTPALTRLLRDAGYSYVVVSPRVTTATDDILYRSALKREWLPEIE